MNTLDRRKKFDLYAILVFTGALILFLFIIYFVPTDIPTHANKVKEINEGKSAYPPNFLYYLVLNIFCAFSKNQTTILNVSSVILAVSVMFKYVVTRDILVSCFNDQNRATFIRLISIACLLLFALPDLYSFFFLHQYYLGRIVPNVWHNSTTITLFPFAILLFWKQYQVLSGTISLNAKNLFLLFMLMVVNVTIKPSFFMVYAPVTSVALLLILGVKRDTFLNLIPVLLCGFLLYFLQKLIYTYNIGSYYEEKSELVISKPFEVWSHFMPLWYIPVAIIISFLLPISYLLVFRSLVKVNRLLFLYTIGLMITGLCWAIMVAETGPRMFHANFFWQNVVCIYLLDMIILIDAMARYFSAPIMDKRMKIFGSVFLLHIVSGIIYIAWMFVRHTFY